MNNVDMIVENLTLFIKNNNSHPSFVHVSKHLFKGVDSVGIILPDSKKEYSIIVKDGVISEVLHARLEENAFNVTLRDSQINKILTILRGKNHAALITEAQKLKIPLKFKMRFGSLYLTSQDKLRECKELFESLTNA
jgi:hypothetical protein